MVVPNLIHTHDLPTHTQLGHGRIHVQGGLRVLGVHQVFNLDARLVAAFAGGGIGDVIGFVVEQKQLVVPPMNFTVPLVRFTITISFSRISPAWTVPTTTYLGANTGSFRRNAKAY